MAMTLVEFPHGGEGLTLAITVPTVSMTGATVALKVKKLSLTLEVQGVVTGASTCEFPVGVSNQLLDDIGTFNARIVVSFPGGVVAPSDWFLFRVK